ncbi:hypothetical protein HUG10_09930 [Halorarum halophilum]|uniref:Uncharacterized protein n=1 Tax=Halorarum halophilum TaxID=2743090 RepID=A0A7D5GBW5_9EURY|nr:hypothetical protein [Halobaculum halophilum]QLG27852.1 hypothetical protein HUG10_09930 [Halobaculum halophilum]
MNERNYRVVSEVRSNGDLLDVPSDAHDVTIEPLGQPGLVRVTYLSPVREIEFTDGGEDGGTDADDDRPTYLA